MVEHSLASSWGNTYLTLAVGGLTAHSSSKGLLGVSHPSSAALKGGIPGCKMRKWHQLALAQMSATSTTHWRWLTSQGGTMPSQWAGSKICTHTGKERVPPTTSCLPFTHGKSVKTSVKSCFLLCSRSFYFCSWKANCRPYRSNLQVLEKSCLKWPEHKKSPAA